VADPANDRPSGQHVHGHEEADENHDPELLGRLHRCILFMRGSHARARRHGLVAGGELVMFNLLTNAPDGPERKEALDIARSSHHVPAASPKE